MTSERVPIEQLYQVDAEREQETIFQISIGNNIDGQASGLWYYNQTFALYSFFKQRDLNACKQHFYRCGRIDKYLIKKYEARILDYGVNHVTYALLCDNLGWIRTYADLTHPWYYHTIKSGSLTHAMQNIVKENWEGLRADISTYERITQTKKGKINIPDLMFFKGMLHRDQQMVTDAIQLLLKDHKKRNRHMGIAQDYISIPALGYAKLAWLKGMEVEIDHPLIPKELLPFRPLEHYEDKYEFLREI